MNTVRLETIVNTFMNHTEFDPANFDIAKSLIEFVNRGDFQQAAYNLKELCAGCGFYPDEYKVRDEFCKIIRIELSTLGKSHFHQEIEKRIDFLFDGAYFDINTAIILPAISYEKKTVLSVEKLEAAVSYFSERGHQFDSVLVAILGEIDVLNNKMKNYCQDK